LPKADERQRANHRADLMMQETARGDLDDHMVALTANVEPV